jgi:hypothetical protein
MQQLHCPDHKKPLRIIALGIDADSVQVACADCTSPWSLKSIEGSNGVISAQEGK